MKLRVLWFTNTTSNADEYFNKELKGSGGWLKALDQAMQNKVELHVAFHNGYNKLTKFRYENTVYYPIQIFNSKYQRYLHVLLNKVYDSNYKNKYLKIISEVDPDIIHIHGTENFFGSIIGEVNKPIVVSIQGLLTTICHKYFSGIDKKYLTTSVRKYYFFHDSFKINFSKIKRMAEIEKVFLLRTRYIFGQTDWDRRSTRILAPKSLYFNSNRILRDSFYNNVWEYKHRDTVKIITTTANSFYKGLETICLAMNELNKIGFNCEWYLIGVSQNDLIVSIVRKLLKHNFPKKGLIFLGSLDQKLIVDSLLESSIYVMPSNIENESNALYEAMMLGMPCITTLAGGTNSTVENNTNGVIVQTGDPWVLAGTIVELAKDVNKLRQIGRRARQDSLKRHNKEEVVNTIVNNYFKIIEDHIIHSNS